MQVNIIAKERAAIGGPGFTVRTACRAICAQPETVLSCDACACETGAPAGLLPLPPHAASVPLTAAPVPSFKNARRFIVVSRLQCVGISFPRGRNVELEQIQQSR